MRPAIARRFGLSYPETRLPRKGPVGIPPESEAQFQHALIEFARVLGYRVYHTHDSRGSAAGFPDLVLANPQRHRLVFLELKRDGGRLTHQQAEWITTLQECGTEAYIVTPAHWPQIAKVLSQ